MEFVLTLQDVSVYGQNGQELLPSMNLNILPGECVCIVAQQPRFEALTRIIGGFTEPDSGRIELLGRSIQEWHHPIRTAYIGYMSFDPGFLQNMTVLGNTSLPLMAAGISRHEREESALSILESLGIGYAAYIYPTALSPCEQRLAALSRALITDPALLILNDPISMLNEKESARFIKALAEHWRSDRFSVLYRTWDGSEIIPTNKILYL